jgi:hypothetical protein
MLRGALRWAVVIVVISMLGGHVTELFDRWDHTLRTGKDADYAVVMVAACTGLAFAIAKRLLSFFRGLRVEKNSPVERSSSPFQVRFAETSATGPSPPLLLSLRI